MKLIYLSLFTGIISANAFQPADRAALKTAVDACTTSNGDGTGSDHAGDGSKCYACLDGTIVATASTTCTDASTPTFITNWDTSLVTNMETMLHSKSNFNQALNWDTSSVTKMANMFYGTTIFNQDISAFDTSKVTDFSYMFYTSGFNQDISSWDVSGGTNFAAMFQDTLAFNQDISSWDMSSALELDQMFKGTAAATNKFNQDISAWDTSSVTTMTYMFNYCEFDQDISCWDIAAVTTFKGMFFRGSMSKTLCWDTSGGNTDHSFSYSGGGSFDSTCTASCPCAENEHVSSGACVACAADKVRPAGDDPAGADTTCKTPAFKPADRAALKSALDACVGYYDDGSECYACLDGTMKTSAVACTAGDTAQFISDWDTSLVTDMNALFKSKYAFNQDIGAWDTSSVTTFADMFWAAYVYNNGDELLNWDTSSATVMTHMFTYSDFNQCLCGWDTSKVTAMNAMFYSNPTSTDKDQKFNQDISCWDVSSVTTFHSMFYEQAHMAQTLCWDTGSAITTYMFLAGDGSVDSTCTSTGCILTACKENEHVSGGACVACPADESNDAGDDWVGADTTCTQWCAVNKKLVAGVCTACPVGSSSDGGLVTECTWTCNANEKVESGACVACPAGEVSVGGAVTTCSKAVFKPADKAAFKTVVDACITASADGSTCYACVDGEVHSSASGTCTDGSTLAFISDWDTSLVTDMSSVFYSKPSFNQDISRWDVSSVTTFENMFKYSSAFNQDLSCWDISSMTNGRHMFRSTGMSQTLCWGPLPNGVTLIDIRYGANGVTIDSCTPTGCTASGLACSADDECISGACDTTCQVRCAQDEHVAGGACAICAAGKTRDAGDDPAGGDTVCAFKPCAQDEHVAGGACAVCATGKTRNAGDFPPNDTTCNNEPVFKLIDHDDKTCEDAGYVTLTEAECQKYKSSVSSGTITGAGGSYSTTAHPAGCTIRDYDLGSWYNSKPEADTTTKCDNVATVYNCVCKEPEVILCAINQRVVSNDCVDCPAGETSAAGANMAGADTTCNSPTNFKKPDTTCASVPTLCTRRNKEAKATTIVCPNHICTTDVCCQNIAPTTCQAAIDATSTMCTKHGRANAPDLSATCAKHPCKIKECCVASTRGCNTGTHCNVGTFDIHDESKCFACHSRATCTAKKCVCPDGYGGVKCDIQLSTGAKQDKIKNIRSSFAGSTDNDKKQRQEAYKIFVQDIVRAKINAGASVKDTIMNNMLTIAKSDLPTSTAAIITKTPRVAAVPDNSDQDDDCHLGASATNCGMVDLKNDRDNNQQTIVSVGDDVGSWAVVVDGGSTVSKQIRTSATTYDMQCWDNEEDDWGATEEFTAGSVFQCNNKAIFIGSQIGICDETTCQNGGTCAASGNTFTCICPIVWSGQLCDVPNAGGNNGTSATCSDAFDNADKVAFQNLNCACANTCDQ